MASEMELIEARLTAYIDGQLPESERADIEKYLASNPPHARLIAELQRQRALLRTLPKEAAPVEIMDQLQAQLERGGLLSDEADTATMKINRWPQLGAVAAMLLLAAGLGALVYQVLPRGAVRTDQLVLGPSSVQQMPTVPSLSEAQNGADAKIETKDKESDPGQPGRPEDHIIAGRDVARSDDARRNAQGDVLPNLRTVPELGGANRALPPADPAIAGTVTIRTDNLAQTSAAVATYLLQNGLAFEVPLQDQSLSSASSVRFAASVDRAKLETMTTAPSTFVATNAPATASNTFVVRNVDARQVQQLREAMAQSGQQRVELTPPMELAKSDEVMKASAAENSGAGPRAETFGVGGVRGQVEKPVDAAAQSATIQSSAVPSGGTKSNASPSAARQLQQQQQLYPQQSNAADLSNNVAAPEIAPAAPPAATQGVTPAEWPRGDVQLIVLADPIVPTTSPAATTEPAVMAPPIGPATRPLPTTAP